MGYCIELRESEFFVPFEKKQAALAAIQKMDPTTGDGNGFWDRKQQWSWVSQDNVNEARTLEEAMDCWRFTLATAENGDVIGISFDGEKIGDEDKLFEVIAPFVKDGSYLEMYGEDGDTWRWSFRGGRFKTIQGEVVFRDED